MPCGSCRKKQQTPVTLPTGFVAVERTKERDEILLLSGGEMERPNLGIESRVAVTAAVVILDHVFERGDAAMVHEGRGAGDLAERRHPEVALARARVFPAPWWRKMPAVSRISPLAI